MAQRFHLFFQFFNVCRIYVVRFICLLCNLVDVAWDCSHSVYHRCDIFHIIKNRLTVKYHSAEIFCSVCVASLSPAFDFIPVTKVKCQFLAFYLFVFSCYFYQSFLMVIFFVYPSNEGFRFRATGSLNSDFAGISQNRDTDFFGVRKNLCLLSDSCEIRVKMRFFKQLYRCPIGLNNYCSIMFSHHKWPLETPL